MNADREPLYQQAYKAHVPPTGHREGIRAVVDLVFDAHPAERPDWEVLNKATESVMRHGHDPSNLYTVLDVADYLTALADRLEAEHKAAQEKAAAEAAREKLIEQAALILAPLGMATAQRQALALAEAGLLTAPETKG